ncbi:MAG: YfjI family protein [Methylococcales bacterium]
MNDFNAVPPARHGGDTKILQNNYITPEMTLKANGISYSGFLNAGWSDAQLIAEGYMENNVVTVSNDDFLYAIFGKLYSDVLVTSFHDDPMKMDTGRGPICWSAHRFCDKQLEPDSNQFFTVSIFKPDECGYSRRQKIHFVSQHCVVLDDVCEKLSAEEVKRLPPPSWVLETSSGSEHWGYILETPCTDRHQLDNLTDGLIESDLAPDSKDPGMRGVTRYMRLPEGVNTKASKKTSNGDPFKCQLLQWNPSLKYTLDDLAKPFNIDLNAARNHDHEVQGNPVDMPDHPVLKKLNIKANNGKGKIEITCPWVHEHTDNVDNGAAIWTRDDGSIGFKCHHGHCEMLHGSDVIAKLVKDFPEFEAKYSQFVNDITFADVPIHTAVFKTLRPLILKLRPVPEFPVDALPQSLRGWIVDEAERMGAPVDFIAIGALVSLSSLLGKKFTIKPKQHDDWTVVPNLWGACVGRPSSMKSPTQRAATDFIREIDTQCRENHRMAVNDYKIDLQVHDLLTKSVISESKKLKNKEEIKTKITELQTNIPAEPKLEQKIINSCTVEKLQMILEDNSNGVLVIHDELSGLLSRLSKNEHSEDRAFLLTAFNGDQSFTVDRVTRKSVYIKNCICSVLGGIQPSKLLLFMDGVSKGLGPNDDGLIQRFQLLVYPDFLMKDLVDRKPEEHLKILARSVFMKFHTFLQTDFSCLNFNDEAQISFNNFHREMNEKTCSEKNIGIEAHLGKYPSLMASLSLILYLADIDEIESVTADVAISAIILCNYFEEHARRIYGIEDSVEYRANILSKKLYTLENGFTVRDVLRKNWSGLSNQDQIIEAINELIDHGYLAKDSTDYTTGRPTKKYTINPTLL